MTVARIYEHAGMKSMLKMMTGFAGKLALETYYPPSLDDFLSQKAGKIL
jgi:hypothetical protein